MRAPAVTRLLTRRQATRVLAFAGLSVILPLSPVQAQGQVQLRCEGTLLEARGMAETRLPTERLRFSLGLEAEAEDAGAALAVLQGRLASVRQALQALTVEELEVSSPTSYQRPTQPRRPAAVVATLQVSGRLEPGSFQALIRQVGALPGVRLAPVQAESDPSRDHEVRARLLPIAYQDALRQVRQLADVIGMRQLRPLQVLVEGSARPVPFRAMAEAAAPPPFDPAELPRPLESLALQVQFCAS